MMKQLKCFLFGKFLKPLFTILLISFFGLSLNSSVKAEFTQTFPISENITVNDDFGLKFQLLDGANFLYNYENKLFSFYRSSNGGNNYELLSNLFRVDGRLYYIISNGRGINIIGQGFVDKGCFTDYLGFCDQASVPIDTFYSNSVYSHPSSLTFYDTGLPSTLLYSYYCFDYFTLDSSFCFPVSYYNGNFYNLTGSLNFPYNPYGNDLSLASDIQNAIGDSNFSTSNYHTGDTTDTVWVFEDSENITKGTLYDVYIKLGYNIGLCYSDFNIGTLAVADSGTYLNQYGIFSQFLDYNDCEDGELYCGASVFDLRQSYLTSIYDEKLRFKNLYNTFSSSYKNFNINGFVGKSKGLWYLPYKLYNAVENEFLNFDPGDYMNFCDMAINGFDSISYYTGDISYDVSSYLENNGTSVLSGAGSDVSSIFDGFNKLYTVIKNYNANVPNGIPGVLPSYIIFAFFLFLLLYGLKR